MKSRSRTGTATRKSSAPSPDSISRGSGWVISQTILGLLWLVAPRVEGRWPRRLGLLATVLGSALTAAGFALLSLGYVGLGPSFTVFPRPRSSGGLATDGIYAYMRNPMYDGVILVAVGLGL